MSLPKARKINAEKYLPGLSLFRQKYAKVKLSANESALGPSPRAIKEYTKASKDILRYPDADGNFLKKTISKKFKINFDQIILGSGSDQIFELLCKLFLKKGDEVIVSQYSFIIYRIYSRITGAKVLFAKEKNYKISIKNILSKVTNKTKIVFLANPNNPTGTFLNKKDLLYLRKKLRKNILLVIDDAYNEYVKDKDFSSGLTLFSKSKNVVVTRTFSKIYGLAGLRVGWGYGPKYILKVLNILKPPFNVNRAALFAASAAINDTSWLKKEIKHVRRWSKILYYEFKKLKIETNKSGGNFLLVNFNKIKRDSKEIFQKLANNGILVRRMEVYGIKNSLRITIGKSKENKKLIKVLKKLINV